jgi:hypothetical protein
MELLSTHTPEIAGGSRRSDAANGLQITQRARHRKLFESIRPDPEPLVLEGGLYTSLTFLRRRETTNAKFVLVKVVAPPGSGPIPHLHRWNDEWFYTPDGGAVMLMGSRRYPDFDAPPDKAGKDRLTMVPMEKHDLMYGPRHYIHGYVNASDKPITVYIVWRDSPHVSIAEYFEKIHEPAFNERGLGAPHVSLQALRAIGQARQYGMNFSTGYWEYASEIEEDPGFGHSNIGGLEELIREGEPRSVG